MPGSNELVKTGNYDMKARVVAEKLKGKKDLQVIEWARSTLNFHIQYRRNIYRWKKNPIILKLAQQYAGLIDDADVPDRIRNSYRVLNSKAEDIYELISDYIGMAFKYEIPVDESLMKAKIQQLYPVFGISSEEASSFIGNACDRLKRQYRALLKKTDLENIKSISKQVKVSSWDELRSLINSGCWKNLYYLHEDTVYYQLLDTKRTIMCGLDDYLDEDVFDLDTDDNDFTPYLFNQLISVSWCSSFDGDHKCNLSFCGPFAKPPKMQALNSKCDYRYSETAMITKSHFILNLQSIAAQIQEQKKYNGQERLLLFCEDCDNHNIPDTSVPECIKLVLVDSEIHNAIRKTNKILQELRSFFRKRILEICSDTLNEAVRVNYDSEKPQKEMISHLINLLKTPLVDSMNILHRYWMEISAQTFHNEIRQMSSKSVGTTSLKELEVYKSVIEEINRNPIFKKVPLNSIEDILNVDRPYFDVGKTLKVETLINTELHKDIIYQKTLQKRSKKMTERIKFPKQDGDSVVSEPNKSGVLSINSILNTSEESDSSSKRPLTEYEITPEKRHCFDNEAISGITNPVEDFRKAVLDLHFQFAENPTGPFRDCEIFREMPFEQIFRLTLHGSIL